MAGGGDKHFDQQVLKSGLHFIQVQTPVISEHSKKKSTKHVIGSGARNPQYVHESCIAALGRAVMRDLGFAKSRFVFVS